MSLYTTFKTDTKKEVDGVRFSYDPNEDGTVPTFIVARQSKANKKYSKVMKELSKPHKRQVEMGTLSEEVGEQLLKTAFIRGCLRGWENVKDQDGNDLPFTEANARKLFDDLPEFFDDLQNQSQTLANYRTEDLEAEAKN